MTDDQQAQYRDLHAPKVSGGGARIRMEDGRVSRALGWFWGVVGTALVGAVLLAANNLYQLNLTVAAGVANDAAAERRFSDHETRLRALEKDVSAIEGKVFRSGFDPLKDPVK